jgi:hypothetical protein
MNPPLSSRLTILDSERCSPWYYPQKKIVHHQLRAFVHGNDFRGILEAGLAAFQKHGGSKWLSDDRGYSVLTPEDREWAVTQWSPRVIAAGWKYWAIVMPEKATGQMQLKGLIKTYADKGVTVRTFPTPEECMAWLDSV